MAIGTNKKIQEMSAAGKADSTVAAQYKKLETRHMKALSNKDQKYDAIMDAKEKLEEFQTIADSISIFHPIQKRRANQQVENAKMEVRRAENEYELAKQALKDAQRKLREMRKEVREQYKAMKENQKLNKRMQKVRTDRLVTPSVECNQEYINQHQTYSRQVYHIDANPTRNTRMQGPSEDLFAEVNKVYRANVKAKWQNRAKKMAHGIGDTTKTLYRHASKTIGDIAEGVKKFVHEKEI